MKIFTTHITGKDGNRFSGMSGLFHSSGKALCLVNEAGGGLV